jgi:hypothetical protein
MYHCLDEDCCHASVTPPPAPVPSAALQGLLSRLVAWVRRWWQPEEDHLKSRVYDRT